MITKECTPRYPLSRFLSALLVAALSLAIVGCSNPEKSKAEYLRRGEAFLKEKKYQEATIEFRNALLIDNRMAAAHWGLAQAYEALQLVSETIEALRHTVDLDPNNLEARVKLGTYYLAGKLVAEAEKLAKEILLKDPNHIEGHILMASVLFEQNQREEAFRELNRAIELNPQRVESYLSLARFHAQVGDHAKAEETFRRALNMNEKSAAVHTDYGKFLAQMSRLDEAEAQFKRAIELEPQNRDARFVLASFYLVNKQMDKAEAAYKALAEIDGSQPEGRAVLADFYSASGRMDEALRLYQEIVQTSPDFERGRYRLGEILLVRGDTGGANAQAEELLKRNANDMQGRLLRARVRLQGGDARQAIEDLKEVLKQEPNSRAGLYYMADASLRLGQVEQARVFAGDLERNHPNYLQAKLLQVQINLTANDEKTALRLSNDLLERLSKTTPDRQTSPQSLAELRARTLSARGATQLRLGNMKAAREDFEASRAETPNSAEPYLNLATVAVREKKLDEAEQLYNRALAIDSTNFDGLYGIIKVYSQQKRLDQAHARIDQAAQTVRSTQPNNGPLNASLHYLKAQVYGFEKNAQAAESELRRAIEIYPDYLAAYNDLGAMYANLKQTDRAIAEYRKVLDRKPDSAATYTLIGMLEDSRQNHTAAVESYRRALEFDQNATIAANNLAWLYAAHNLGNLDEAARLAQGVVQKHPDVASFRDTLAWIYYRKGSHAAAIEQLQKALAGDKDNALYRYHLGLALAGKGDKAGARRELEEALRLSEKSNFSEAAEARKALATL
jgi:tetratricopeptide (TPR) repeat protein